MTGRFAPSPTGELHLGNLRTAAIAWLAARSEGRRFLVRMEDLDQRTADPAIAEAQLADMRALGMDWDGEVVWQRDRFDLYHDAIADLRRRGLVYECFCTRREIAAEIEAAPRAPHAPPGAYPGTCRDASRARLEERRASGRPAALRLRADGEHHEFDDRVLGRVHAAADDVVLRRNDGVPAYNLAVVVDDAEQGVTQVVRGDDLAPSTPRQVLLQALLGLPRPEYAHVALVVGDDGERLAKRHGAVSLSTLAEVGVAPDQVVAWILETIGCRTVATLADAVETFRVEALADAVTSGTIVAPEWPRTPSTPDS